MHRTTTHYRQGNAPARLALVVIALLFGLLGMHALSIGHGVMPGHPDQMGQISDAGITAHAGPTVTAVPSGHAAVSATDGSGGGGDQEMGGMLMLCLAVLGAAAALLLSRVFMRGLLWRRPTLDAVIALLVAATHRVRSSRPPPVWEFSVIRC